MKSYLFEFGDSAVGPLGCCIRVKADTPEEALEIVRDNLCVEFIPTETGDQDRIEYCNVYVTPANITLDDLQEGETEEIGQNG